MNPWFLLGGVCAAFLTFIGGFSYGTHVQDLKAKAEILVRTEKARQKEQEDAAIIATLRQAYAQETQKLYRRYVATLNELRERPERMSESARAACQGATGAELSGPDAGFLAWFAAEAQRIALENAECRAWIDHVRGSNVPR